jgi:large subunit ribosomal protein L19
MRTKAIEIVESKNVAEAARKGVPQFQAGDTLRVHTKVREGEKERVQIFEGVCIRKKNNGTVGTFTVRKVSYGVGVERVFPTFSPRIEKIERVSSSDVSRARLFFLRELAGKKARLKTREEGSSQG